jgi:hypothetical protein
MNILMYYIMPQRIDMRLIASQSAVKKPRTNNVITNNVITNNNMASPSRQRTVPFGGNVFKGNMNGVFNARGRSCG